MNILGSMPASVLVSVRVFPLSREKTALKAETCGGCLGEGVQAAWRSECSMHCFSLASSSYCNSKPPLLIEGNTSDTKLMNLLAERVLFEVTN